MEPLKVLFICGKNRARSQMAEAWLNRLGGGAFVAESAGLEPGPGVHPLAVAVMAEEGIDIAANSVDSVEAFFLEGREYDVVIAVCDAAKAGRCPVFPGKGERLHWPFDDPEGLEGTEEEKLAATRSIRDAIRSAVEAFIAARS
ncbi:arsenate reductase ArsC [Aminithiophilus ramosus]|uniref:Arsenate reductase ArsC n=2 Tax=Synergistales TaxID=649776 RepID=A0A9Q7ANC7_9BACT|nr:arsenate reductase ArsC [Aminithiophilus ramosus]QTX32473.1 arsenate reductase ArsC [Aminithiophilus ramosus]QVL36350.1 arsenate reductase ArsC [Synergistota bacterium]